MVVSSVKRGQDDLYLMMVQRVEDIMQEIRREDGESHIDRSVDFVRFRRKMRMKKKGENLLFGG